MPIDALAAPHSIVAGILPGGIAPRTVTTGPWTLPDGTVATGRATVTCPVNLVHTPTGQPIASGDMSVRLVDGMASWDLCPTDQAGLTQTGWTYTLRVELNGALMQPEPIAFQLLSASPNTVDLDTLTRIPSSNGTSLAVQILDEAVAGLLNDTTSATYARVIELIAARAGFGGI